jgi:hypothetical protein
MPVRLMAWSAPGPGIVYSLVRMAAWHSSGSLPSAARAAIRTPVQASAAPRGHGAAQAGPGQWQRRAVDPRGLRGRVGGDQGTPE